LFDGDRSGPDGEDVAGGHEVDGEAIGDGSGSLNVEGAGLLARGGDGEGGEGEEDGEKAGERL
jgi:hypothetical protein